MQTAAMILFSLFLVSASSQDLREVTVNAGENAPLECRGARDAPVTLLKWSRSDLSSDGYVFFYRDERSYENYQHPSFYGRVQLRDPEMKHGDVSVILKNVTANDTGTYECYMSASSTGRRKRDTSHFSKTVTLVVEDSGHTTGRSEEGGSKDGGSKDGHAGVFLLIGVVAVFGIFVTYKQHKKQNSNLRPEDEAL